jgi:drug/metabolite transporter (DMT)-like permease
MQPQTNLNRRALPYVVLLGTVWGGNLTVSRLGVGQFEIFSFVSLRALVATSLFVLIYALNRQRRWPHGRRIWLQGLMLGSIGTAFPMLSILGSLQFQSSGVTSLLITTAPAITVLIAHFFIPAERLSWTKGLGVLTAMAGVLLIIIRGETGLPDVTQANPLGYLMVFAGVSAEGFMAAYTRLHMTDTDPFDVTAIRMLVVVIVVVPLTLLFRPPDFSAVTSSGVVSLLYSAIVGGFIAQILSFFLSSRFGPTAFSLTGFVVPVVAAIFGVVLLGETITTGMLMGTALILSGITILNLGSRSKAPVQAVQPS